MRRDDPRWKQGVYGERVACDWLRSQGYYVVRASLIDDGGAPLATSNKGSIVLPDNFVSRDGKSAWVEVKCKSRPAIYHKIGKLRESVDLRNWYEYLRIEKESGFPGYLAIVELEPERVLIVAPLQRLARCVQIDPRTTTKRGPAAWFPFDAFDRFPIESLTADAPPALPPETHYPWDRPLKKLPPQQPGLFDNQERNLQ